MKESDLIVTKVSKDGKVEEDLQDAELCVLFISWMFGACFHWFRFIRRTIGIVSWCLHHQPLCLPLLHWGANQWSEEELYEMGRFNLHRWTFWNSPLLSVLETRSH